MAEHEMRVAIKRVYEQPTPGDGIRVLVDRLWARGISKDAAHLDSWMKELGPSDALRTWFGHRPEHWEAFVERYRQELQAPVRQLLLAELQGLAVASLVTLVYGARDTAENEAVVLRDELLQDKVHPPQGGAWDASAALLLTVAVVAAAHGDAVAPASTVRQFASTVLSAPDLERAHSQLLGDGSVREESGGWQLTALGTRKLRPLERASRTG